MAKSKNIDELLFLFTGSVEKILEDKALIVFETINNKEIELESEINLSILKNKNLAYEGAPVVVEIYKKESGEIYGVYKQDDKSKPLWAIDDDEMKGVFKN